MFHWESSSSFYEAYFLVISCAYIKQKNVRNLPRLFYIHFFPFHIFLDMGFVKVLIATLQTLTDRCWYFIFPKMLKYGPYRKGRFVNRMKITKYTNSIFIVGYGNCIMIIIIGHSTQASACDRKWVLIHWTIAYVQLLLHTLIRILNR